MKKPYLVVSAHLGHIPVKAVWTYSGGNRWIKRHHRVLAHQYYVEYIG